LDSKLVNPIFQLLIKESIFCLNSKELTEVISVRWVTRSFPHVDRIASAWLIKRFIDPEAEFVFINWPEEELKF